MSLYYPTNDCATTQSAYYCNPCPTLEYGRVRSIAFVKKTYLATVLLAPSTAATWTTGINSGNIIVIWQTSGTYDGSTTAELPGFGDQAIINGNRNHVLTVKDPNYKDNCDFWNDIQNSNEWTVVYRTSSLIHFSTATVTITSKNPIADDISSIVAWEATVKWVYSSAPCGYTTPSGTFDRCYVYA